MIDEMREYIRHPTDIPIECSVQNATATAAATSPRMQNISHSGLSFITRSNLAPGLLIHLQIPLNNQIFEIDGIVMWCLDMDGFYEMGVKFTDDQTEFSVRMIEQMCQIEHYRHQVHQLEGRDISSEQAGKEWVEKFAGSFPE